MNFKEKKEKIKQMMIYDETFLKDSVLLIYDLQTKDEKKVKDTKHSNGVGFNAADGKYLSTIAEKLLKEEKVEENEWQKVKNKMVKYSGQLSQLA